MHACKRGPIKSSNVKGHNSAKPVGHTKAKRFIVICLSAISIEPFAEMNGENRANLKVKRE